MTDKYWMVLRSPGLSNGNIDRKDRPGFIHETRESAEKAAEKLACQHNDSFLILEGVAWVHAAAANVQGLPSLVPVYEALP
jgi:hypothetical protein